ncbi:MAG: glycoside hydrolase family 108 protein [Thalassobaculum sp.]
MSASIGARIADAIIKREGGYVDHPSDRGGPTKYGVTEAVARANGYRGAMEDLPRDFAHGLFVDRYFRKPGFDRVAKVSEKIAAELTDTAVNCGPGLPPIWLQEWLNGFNRQGKDYPDLTVDGAIGPITIDALQAFLSKRGSQGETVMLAALNCSQGARYLDLTQRREKNEDFLYGWLRDRVVKPA